MTGGAEDAGALALAELGRAEAARSAAFLGTALPAALRPVFGEAFIRSHLLYGEFVCRLVLGIARASALEAALAVPGSSAEIAERAGLRGAGAPAVVDWMLRYLAARGWIQAAGAAGAARRYRVAAPWPALDPAPVREEQRRFEPSWMPAYALAETVARDYPAFLRGEVSGEEVLFAPRRLRLWIEYFSNDNGLYAVNNAVGAVAAAAWLPEAGGGILEIGGGLASGALALLARLEATGRLGAVTAYRFTEPVSAFLRRGEQALRARYPERPAVTAGELDMNRRFAEQGLAPGRASLVYAVNTLHAARDLAFTLGEVRRALAPGGWLVLSECVRAAEPIYADFAFHLTEAFRSAAVRAGAAPHGGFLGPAEWAEALEGAGFADVQFLPDLARIRGVVADFSAAAIGARRPEGRPEAVC